ncbi:hypothetical protein [Micromonospora sp. CPCC 206061]|uniref:hypothetical protein n=1 Tax=Micromonospora sp. CPCC 206061 TaxID=3122410 RepID=UPI002FF221FF
MSLLPATAAGAQPTYPPGQPSLTVSPATVVVGATVVVEGNNFGGCDVVRIDVSYAPAGGAAAAAGQCTGSQSTQALDHSVTADANGHFVTTVRLTQVGVATITASGFPSGRQASATVTVLAAAQLEPASVTESNGDGMSVTTLGAVAVAVGLPLLALALVLRRARPRSRH